MFCVCEVQLFLSLQSRFSPFLRSPPWSTNEMSTVVRIIDNWTPKILSFTPKNSLKVHQDNYNFKVYRLFIGHRKRILKNVGWGWTRTLFDTPFLRDFSPSHINYFLFLACTKTVVGSCCVFPFQYGGKTHNKCVKSGSNYICRDKSPYSRRCA